MSQEPAADLLGAVRRLAEAGGDPHVVEAFCAELDPDVLRDAMTLLVRSYAAMRQGGLAFLPVQDSITATDAVVMCHGVLQAADLQVFELGLWQSWGRV